MIHTTTQLGKFKRLKRRLGVPRDRDLIGLLEALWHLTMRDAVCGDIGRLENLDIAIAMEWDGDPDALIAALVAEGWIDEHPMHRLVVHDWAQHAPKFVKGIVSKKGGFCVAAKEDAHDDNQRQLPLVADSKDCYPKSATKSSQQHNLTKHNLTPLPLPPSPELPPPAMPVELPLPSEEEGEEEIFKSKSKTKSAAPSSLAEETRSRLVAELRQRCGVVTARQLVSDALRRGVPAELLQANIDHFCSVPLGWEPGYLASRIATMELGDALHSPPWIKPARPQAMAKPPPSGPSLAEQRERHVAETTARQQRFDELWPRLSETQQRQVVETVFAGKQFMLDRYRQKKYVVEPGSSMIPSLLDYFAEHPEILLVAV